MKKLLCSLCSIILIGGLFTIGETSIQARVHIPLDHGISVNDRTLLPMRDLFEAINATVHWDQKTKTVNAAKDNKKIALKIGSKQATVNGKTLALDVPAIVIDGSTYVPVRFVAESLGVKADYNAEWKEVYLDMADAEVTISVSPAYNVGEVRTKFRPNTSYVFKYQLFEGTEKISYVGVKGGAYVFKSDAAYFNVNSDITYRRYMENKDGLYVRYDGSSSYERILKYPIYEGQRWTESYMTYEVIATDLTYKTPVKTFNNVIKILDI